VGAFAKAQALRLEGRLSRDNMQADALRSVCARVAERNCSASAVQTVCSTSAVRVQFPMQFPMQFPVQFPVLKPMRAASSSWRRTVCGRRRAVAERPNDTQHTTHNTQQTATGLPPLPRLAGPPFLRQPAASARRAAPPRCHCGSLTNWLPGGASQHQQAAPPDSLRQARALGVCPGGPRLPPGAPARHTQWPARVPRGATRAAWPDAEGAQMGSAGANSGPPCVCLGRPTNGRTHAPLGRAGQPHARTDRQTGRHADRWLQAPHWRAHC